MSGRWAALGVLCASLLAIVVDNTIVNVALPTLVRDLDADVAELQWVVDAYTLVFRGLAGDDRWFVRTEGYVGVCAALAWEKPLVIPPGETIERHVRVLVADGMIRP